MRMMKKKKIFLSAILVVLIGLLVYSGTNIFKSKNKVEADKFNVFNPVTDQDNKIDGTNYITFDTFFLSDEDGDGEAEGYHGAEILNGNSEKLYFELNISGDVTLKNGKITFVNDNVDVSGTIPRSSLFDKTYYSDHFKSIDLKDVGNGVSSFFSLNVKPTVDTDLTKFNGVNKVILTGTVYDAVTGEETPITKEVTYNVNAFTQNISYYYEDAEVTASTADRILVYYKIKTTEGYNEMPLDETHLDAVVSKLAGEDPINVFVTTSSEYSDDVEYTYDAGTRTLHAVKKATIENNQITQKAYTYLRNKRRVSEWHVFVEYRYDSSIKNELVSLSTTIWANGIKNANGDIQESAKKNTVYSQLVTALTQGQGEFIDHSSVTIGTHVPAVLGADPYYFVDKSNIISAYETGEFEDVLFEQNWHIDMTTADETESITISEDKGIIGGGRDLSQYVTYDSVIVRPNSYYNKNRALTIINDETNETLFVINSDNYYTKLTFPNNVHKVRIETNKVGENVHLDYYFQFERRMDTQKIVNDFTLDEFNAGNLKNTIEVWAEYERENITGETGKLPHDGNATFSDQLSYVVLDSDKETYTRPVSSQTIPMKLQLSTNYDGPAFKKWESGIFLLKIPSIILGEKNLDIYSDYFDVISSEKVKIGNDNFIRIQFKAKDVINNLPVTGGTTGYISVDFDAVISPKQSDDVATFALYGKNLTNTRYQNYTEDVYDLDENYNTSEYVALSSKQVHISIPSEVITGASITDYDSFDSTVVSPLVANVNPLRGSSDATMNVFLINYSNNNIDNVYFIGKTGFIGNTYQIGDGDLGTTFDSYMDGPITYDASLNGVVTVYYSDQETPTNDLSDLSNNWTTNPSDYHSVKSYMILFDSDYVVNVGEEVDFSYPIELPTNTLALNKISYYTHGAYFNYLTSEGTYSSNASSGKLGVRMARTYDLHVQLYKKFASSTPILSGDFKLTNVNEPEDSRTIHISRGGFADLEGLIVNDEYQITQISADKSAVVDDEVRSFRVINDTNDELVLQDSGNFRRIELDNNLVLQVELENDVWYQTYFHTYDYDTGDPVHASYKVTGRNYENGVRFSLDENGGYLLKNLVPNEVYKVEQIYVDGYVKTKSFDFKVVRDLDDNSFDVTTRQAPTITRSGDCASDVTTTTNGYGFRVNINKVYPSTEKDIKCNISLNLAGYKDRYELTGNAYLFDDFVNGNSTLDISLSSNMDYTTAPSFLRLEKDPTYAYYYAGSIDNVYQSFDVTTATTMRLGSPVTVDLKGGSDYNFYINYHRSGVNISSSQNPYTYIDRIKLTHLDGTLDELYQNKTKQHVQSSDNANVYQTIYNDNANAFGNPTLELDIEARGVIKKTLQLAKVDATTGDPLKNAMFKISGPGIPDGEILTTDDNGNASININLSFAGNYYSVPGVGNNSEYPLNNVYTIQEILAPDGYTINNQKVNFMIVADYDYNDVATYKVVYTTNNRYTSATATDQGVFTLGIEDYPLFKVTKTDIETGEVLPNTFYSIYRIDPVTGDETFAKNIYGDIVGEPTTIDDVVYYIVKTNENGEFTLALNAGTYKLVEVQAADEKYDITDQVTYFSIGESAEYKAKGTSIKDLKMIDPKSEGKKISRFTYTTNDEGTLVVEPTIDQYNNYSNFELVKYDSNFNEVWRTPLKLSNAYAPVAEYFDRPGVKYDVSNSYETANDDPQVKAITITEESDSYYIFFGVFEDFRIDKQSGQVLYNNTAHPRTRIRWYFTSICDKVDGTLYSDYVLIPGDDEHVYCSSYENSYVNARMQENYEPYLFDTNSSGTIQAFILSPYSNNHSVIELSDGTFIKNENYDYKRLYLIKGDKNGNFTEAFDTTEKINAALTTYFASKGLNASEVNFVNMNYEGRYSSKIKYFDDGSIIMVLNQASIKYDNSTNTLSFAIKFDSDGNVVFAKPLGYDGNSVSYNNPIAKQLYGGGGVYTYFNINDDGSFDVPYRNSYKNNYTPNSWDTPLYTTEDIQNDIQLSQFQLDNHAWGWSNTQMLHYDADGKQVSRTLLVNNMSPNLNFGYDGFIFNSIYNANDDIDFANRVEDGYIVGMKYNKASFSQNYNELTSLVILRNGESYYLSDPGENTNYVIFKVNDDSKVEWIKEYESVAVSDWGATALMSNLNGENITVAMVTNNTQLKDVYSDEYTVAKDSNIDSYIMLTRFKVSNEFIPEAPAAVNLNLTNSRKQFKINIESNDDNAGTFTIQSGTNPEYIGVAPGEIETVKFGDSSVSDITITPFAGYNIKNITVNGKVIVYQSDINGVVHLDRFDDVRENKNIYVEFEESEARVLVHHYLENTTISIAPDETITGRIGTKYYTVPQESGTYALATDAEDNAIFPSNYQGEFTVAPIEVTYYYVPVVSLEVNYLDQSSYAKLADTITSRAPQGTSYRTTAKSIRSFSLAGVLGDPDGTMDDDLTEVSYLYNRNANPQSKVTTRFVEEGTNNDIVPPVEDYYDVGLTYTTSPLTNPPAPYVYASISGSDSGTVGTEDITVIYYYRKQTGTVITEYRDDVTNNIIAPSVEQTIVYGESYTTSPLATVPEGYTLSRTPDNASDTVNSATVYVVYLYHKEVVTPPDNNTGTVTARYLDEANNKAISNPITTTYNYGETYTTSKLTTPPALYEFVRVEGNETGVVNTPETIVTYWYKLVEPITPTPSEEEKKEEEVPNPKTNDNIMTYVIILAASALLLSGFVLYKKKKNK